MHFTSNAIYSIYLCFYFCFNTEYNQAVQITGDSKFKISVKMAGVNSVSLKLKTIIPTSLVVQLGNNSFLAVSNLED